ncbi:MAG: hypothetical protein K5786_07880 [Treponema sp.]|nr:hypothetical protein [Treponema sp.]
MKKTLMILGVLAALSMVFVGCDQPTTTEDATGGSSSTPTTQATTTDADKPDAATPAAEADDDANNSGDQGDEDEEVKLTKTSILDKIQAGDDVWGSGTKTTANSDGTYTVVAAGAGEGGWGGEIAAIPVQFDAGTLTGFTHIVVELDSTGFTFKDDNEEYPAFELKVEEGAGGSKSKMINATSLYKDGVAEISLSSVDFLDTAKQFIISLRGTGTVIVKDISKAK